MVSIETAAHTYHEYPATLVARKSYQLVDAGNVRAVDTLGLEGDRLEELGRSLVYAGLDDRVLELDAHLVVLTVAQGTLVFLVRVSLAATVIKDGDHGGTGVRAVLGLSRGAAEEGSSHGSGSAGLYDLSAASLHGHHGGEGGSGADEGEGDSLSDHCVGASPPQGLRFYRHQQSRGWPKDHHVTKFESAPV